MRGTRTRDEIIRNIYRLNAEGELKYAAKEAIWITPLMIRGIATPESFMNSTRYAKYRKADYLEIEHRLERCIEAIDKI